MRFSEHEVRTIVREEIDRAFQAAGLEWLQFSNGMVGKLNENLIPVSIRYPKEEKLDALIEHLGLAYAGNKPTFIKLKK